MDFAKNAGADDNSGGTANTPWGEPIPAPTGTYPPTAELPRAEPAPTTHPPTAPFPQAFDPNVPFPPMPPAPPIPPYGSEPQAGYPQPNPYGYNAYGQYPVGPVTMPGSVKAARVIAFIFGGLGVALIVLAAALGNPELAGALTAGFLLPVIMAGCAFTFGGAGNGIRVTVITLAGIEMFFGLGGAVSRTPPGILGFGAGLALVILLCQKSSAAWFKRAR